MAIETALKFLERLEREETLRNQFYISRPKDMPQLLQFMQGKGFIVSEADLEAALNQHKPGLQTGTMDTLKQYLRPRQLVLRD